ncbi:MAG: MBL fold metallo-hydrolase, partial [Burkholderiales bacterium]
MSGPAPVTGLVFLERGWLSANNIVLLGPEQTALVDTGYHSHAAQTVALVGRALAGRPLDLL